MKKWLKSVYSDSTGHYVSNPCPKKGEEIEIKLRMHKNSEIRKVILRTREFGIEHLQEMELCEVYNELLYYSCRLKVEDAVLHYQFYLVTEHEIYYYTQYQITDYIPEESRDFKILTDYQAPDWVNQSVFYQIFPDRFCNGDPKLSVRDGEYSYQGYESIQVKDWDSTPRDYKYTHNVDFYGGDLAGVLAKLDYLQSLGVNAIYLNPIFISPSIHKYDCLDYYHVDPHLGGDRMLIKLVNEMHQRNMKLMLDISINHTSSSAKWFNKDNEFYESFVGAYQNPKSPYRSFYFIGEDNKYDTWCGVHTMPKLNYESVALRRQMYQNKNSVLKKWIQGPFHIDAWRFDVADCLARNEHLDVHREVLKELRKELKKCKENIYLLAEDWADCSEDLQGDSWDATMNYFGCARPVRCFFGEKDLFHARNQYLNQIPERLTAKQLGQRIVQFYSRLPGVIQHQMFNLLDSHDVSRLHNNPAIKEEDYRGAVMMMFTLPGAPSIYYGDEIGLDGRMTDVEGCRYPMNWKYLKQCVYGMDIFHFYQKLAILKRNSKSLHDGGFTIISDEDYVFSYARFTEEEVIFVVCSMDDTERNVILPIENFGLIEFHEESDYFGRSLYFKESDGEVNLRVPPHQNYMMVVTVK